MDAAEAEPPFTNFGTERRPRMAEKKETMEVRIAPLRIVSVTGEIRDIFAVVRALKEDGHDPEIRCYDEELKDNTCWQPTRIAKAA
jgi:hypothetical protein